MGWLKGGLFALILAVGVSNTYTVKSGDTLWSIARDHKVKVSDLYAWNEIRGSVIKVGQRLNVEPNSSVAKITYIGPSEYTVQKGDTLTSIAARYGTKLSVICSINNISPKEVIRVGQKLQVPDGSKISETFTKKSTVIILDAGHGGADTGSTVSGIHEKTLNLQVAYKVKSILQARGYTVYMTRYSDKAVSLAGRVRYSHRYPGALFISIHHNSDPKRRATGIETFYYTTKSRSLGYRIQRDLITATRAKNRKLKHHGYHVLVQNNRSVLVECGFMTSWSELSKIKSSSYQSTIANSIATTISNNYK